MFKNKTWIGQSINVNTLSIVQEHLEKTDERSRKMLTVIVTNKLGIIVTEDLLSYSLMYYIEVERLYCFGLKCSSIRLQ